MQDLYYDTGSSTVILIKENKEQIIWGNITSITNSTPQITILSGSSPRAYFPIDNTNLFYPPYPNPNPISGSVTSSITTTNILWKFELSTLLTNGQLSQSICYIATSSLYYVSQSLYSNNGSVKVRTGFPISFYVSGSGSYNSELNLRDITSGSLVASIAGIGTPVSLSFSPLNFHNYEVTFSITEQPA